MKYTFLNEQLDFENDTLCTITENYQVVNEAVMSRDPNTGEIYKMGNGSAAKAGHPVATQLKKYGQLAAQAKASNDIGLFNRYVQMGRDLSKNPNYGSLSTPDFARPQKTPTKPQPAAQKPAILGSDKTLGGGATGGGATIKGTTPTPTKPQPTTPATSPAQTNAQKMVAGAKQFGSGALGQARNTLQGGRQFANKAFNGGVSYGKAAAIGAGANMIYKWWKNRKNGQKTGFFGGIWNGIKGAAMGAGLNGAARFAGNTYRNRV